MSNWWTLLLAQSVVRDQFVKGTLTHWEYVALSEWLDNPYIVTLPSL